MTTIQIPEGKTSMTLGNGMTIPIPQGATTIDIPDELLQAKEIPSLEILKEEPNQNPFIQQGQEGYNSQVHSMDMNAVNNTPTTSSEPKSFLDTVKDFGTNLFGGLKKVEKEITAPINNSIQKAQDTLIKPIIENSQDNPVLSSVVKAAEDTANLLTPVGEFNFASQYDKKNMIDTAIKENDLPLQAYNDINKLAKTDMSLFANEKDGVKTYNENLANIIIDKFGFDDLGIGSDGKYYATKGNETIQLNKDSLKQITSDIYGDKMELLGGYLGAKKGYDVGKTFGTKGKVIGGAIGGAIGAGAGNIVDMLDSAITNGEQLNASQYLDEVGKAAALDIGGGVAATVAGAVVAPGMKYFPRTKGTKAEQYIDNVIKPNTDENLNSKAIANELGANDTTLLGLASHLDTQKSLSDMFENSPQMVETVLKDSETLKKNLYNNLGATEIKATDNANIKDAIGQKIDEQVKGLGQTYSNIFDTTKKDILDITGDRVINLPPKSYDTIKEKLNILETIPNVAKDEVPANGINPLDGTFKDIATKINSYFLDEAGNPVSNYSLSGIMDVQKTLNSYASKHGNNLTDIQKGAISDIRKSLYSDVERYADTLMNPEQASIVKDKWKEINSGYSDWLKDLGKNKSKLDTLFKDENTIKTLADDMIAGGTIKNDYLEAFGDISQHLKKTAPEKLDEFHNTIINSILQPITVNQKLGGQTISFIDFDAFSKMFDTNNISAVGLNKTFSSSQEGLKKLQTLRDFRKLAEDEKALQNAIYKNQSPLSKEAQDAVEAKRSFLFGAKYFMTRTLINNLAGNFIPSIAYRKYVTDLSKKSRYTLQDLKNTTKNIEMSPEYKSFTPDEKVNMKNLVIQAEEAERSGQSSLNEAIKNQEEINQKDILERIKQDTDNRIKANMLLEHKAIIPPVQIKEGAKEPLSLDIQDRISVKNTKQPSTQPIGQKEQPITFDEYTSKMGINKNEIIQKVEQENNTKQILENPIFNQEDLKLTAPKDGKYNFDNLIEFEGLVKATGNNPADLLQMDKFTNMKGIRNAITRYSEGKPSTRDIEILDSIQRFMDNEGEKFKTRVNDNTSNFDKDFEEADKAGNIPFSNPVVGGASIGAASGTQTDFNQDGKVDEVDVMIGTLIGTIGIKKTMDIFPQYFKK